MDWLEDRALAAAGTLDPTFGVNGVTVSAIGSVSTVLRGLTLQPDGKIVAVGAATDSVAEASHWFVARYTSVGKLDPTFGVNGVVTVALTFSGDQADTVLIEPDGDILVGGGTGAGYAALERFNPDGTPDQTFGIAGRVTSSVSALTAVTGLAEVGGTILVTGPSSSSVNPQFVVAAAHLDGTADTTFGLNGIATTAFTGPFATAYASALAVEPDGTVVVAGTSVLASGVSHSALARFSAAGALIGSAITDFGTGLGDSTSALALQPNGDLVSAGTTLVAAPSGGTVVAFALARYTPGLTLDPTFGQGGKVVTEVGGNGPGAIAVAIQADGKIVAAGGSGTGGFTVARYQPTGKLDPGFGSGGIANIAVGPNAFATALAIQPSGWQNRGRRRILADSRNTRPHAREGDGRSDRSGSRCSSFEPGCYPEGAPAAAAHGHSSAAPCSRASAFDPTSRGATKTGTSLGRPPETARVN